MSVPLEKDDTNPPDPKQQDSKQKDAKQKERRERISPATIVRWQDTRNQIFEDHTKAVIASNNRMQAPKLTPGSQP